MYVETHPSLKWKFLGKAIDSHHSFFMSKNLFGVKDVPRQYKVSV